MRILWQATGQAYGFLQHCFRACVRHLEDVPSLPSVVGLYSGLWVRGAEVLAGCKALALSI